MSQAAAVVAVGAALALACVQKNEPLRPPPAPAALCSTGSAMAGGCTIGANAVVQGAAGGIGREVVKKLFERGVRTVIGVDLRLAGMCARGALFSPPIYSHKTDSAIVVTDASTMSELTALWELDTHPERSFVGLSEPGDKKEELEAFTVSSVALRDAVAGLAGGVSACVCVGGGNPPGIHNTQDPAPATLPMDVYKAQFAFNFGASALTVSACIDALLEGRGNVVLTSSVNGILGIGEVGYSVSKASMHPYVLLATLVCTTRLKIHSESLRVSVTENAALSNFAIFTVSCLGI